MPEHNNFHDLHREVWPCALLARKNSAQTLNNTVWTTVLYNLTDWDPCSAYNSGTGQYTCPRDGMYRVSGGILLGGTAAFQCVDSLAMAVAVNGTRYMFPDRRDDWSQCGATTVYPIMNGVGFCRCAKGDTIVLQLKQTSGSNLPIYTSSADYNFFQVERVGPYRP